VRWSILFALLVLVAPARAEEHLSDWIAQAGDRSLDPYDRCEAVYQLQLLGARAAPALPALLVALADENVDLREVAAETLGHLGAQATPAVPALIAALDDPGLAVRQKAALALGRIGPTAAPAIPPLISALENPASPLQVVAIRSLGDMGPAAWRAIPALHDLYRAQTLPVEDCEAALEALVSIQSPDHPVLPEFVDDLRTAPGHFETVVAVEAIGRLADVATPSAVLALLDALDEAAGELARRLALAEAAAASAAAPARAPGAGGGPS